MAAQKKMCSPIPTDAERVGKTVLDSAYKVHTTLVSGLLESVYAVTMKHVLEKAGVLVETEAKPPIVFDGENLNLDCGWKCWLINVLLLNSSLLRT